MLNRKSPFTPTLFALLLAPGIGVADVDTSDWKCESCPFDDGYRANVGAGATYVGEDGAIRFGNATGYDDKGGYANVDGQGRYVSDGYRLDWSLEDLGLDSRIFTLDAGRQGSFGVHVVIESCPIGNSIRRELFSIPPRPTRSRCPRTGYRQASRRT